LAACLSENNMTLPQRTEGIVMHQGLFPSGGLLTVKDVLVLTGYKSRTTLYRLVRRGQFPNPCAINARQIRWRADDVAAWQNSLPTRRY
jgi:prophage regulatory protein